MSANDNKENDSKPAAVAAPRKRSCAFNPRKKATQQKPMGVPEAWLQKLESELRELGEKKNDVYKLDDKCSRNLYRYTLWYRKEDGKPIISRENATTGKKEVFIKDGDTVELEAVLNSILSSEHPPTEKQAFSRALKKFYHVNVSWNDPEHSLNSRYFDGWWKEHAALAQRKAKANKLTLRTPARTTKCAPLRANKKVCTVFITFYSALGCVSLSLSIHVLCRTLPVRRPRKAFFERRYVIVRQCLALPLAPSLS